MGESELSRKMAPEICLKSFTRPFARKYRKECFKILAEEGLFVLPPLKRVWLYERKTPARHAERE